MNMFRSMALAAALAVVGVALGANVLANRVAAISVAFLPPVGESTAAVEVPVASEWHYPKATFGHIIGIDADASRISNAFDAVAMQAPPRMPPIAQATKDSVSGDSNERQDAEDDDDTIETARVVLPLGGQEDQALLRRPEPIN